MFETITTAGAGYSTKVGEQLPTCWEVAIHFSKSKKLQWHKSFLHEEMQHGLELSHKNRRATKQHQPFNSRLSVGICKIKKPSS